MINKVTSIHILLVEPSHLKCFYGQLTCKANYMKIFQHWIQYKFECSGPTLRPCVLLLMCVNVLPREYWEHQTWLFTQQFTSMIFIIRRSLSRIDNVKEKRRWVKKLTELAKMMHFKPPLPPPPPRRYEKTLFLFRSTRLSGEKPTFVS